MVSYAEIRSDMDLACAYSLDVRGDKTTQFDINSPVEPCPFALRVKHSKPRMASVHQKYGKQYSNGVWADRDLLFSLRTRDLLKEEHGEAIAMLSHKDYNMLKKNLCAREEDKRLRYANRNKPFTSRVSVLSNIRRIYKNRISAKKCAFHKRVVIKQVTKLYQDTNKKKNKYKQIVKNLLQKLRKMETRLSTLQLGQDTPIA